MRITILYHCTTILNGVVEKLKYLLPLFIDLTSNILLNLFKETLAIQRPELCPNFFRTIQTLTSINYLNTKTS